jgi:hypothetical protein
MDRCPIALHRRVRLLALISAEFMSVTYWGRIAAARVLTRKCSGGAGLIGEAGEAFLFAEHLQHVKDAGRGQAAGQRRP